MSKFVTGTASDAGAASGTAIVNGAAAVRDGIVATVRFSILSVPLSSTITSAFSRLPVLLGPVSPTDPLRKPCSRLKLQLLPKREVGQLRPPTTWGTVVLKPAAFISRL